MTSATEHTRPSISNLRKLVARTAVATVLLTLGLGLSSIAPSYAKEKSASVSSEVAAGKWTGIKLSNLPKGASLAVEVTVDGYVAVLLLNEESYRDLPLIDRPLFQGKTDDRIRFSVLAPQTGHYYAVIDNRAGRAARSFTVDIKATAEGIETAPRRGAVDAQLDTITDALQQAFIFEAFVIRAAKCGRPGAFSGSNAVIICAEYARELLSTLGDRKKAADALMFILLHEVGHVLLRQWEYPFYDNEEVADEFATVLMVMFMGEERVRSQAEYFASRDPTEEVKRKLTSNIRHPLSLQRARNILNWMDDPELVYNWQPVLVPRMQTAFLERIKERSPSWTSRALVERELLLRN